MIQQSTSPGFTLTKAAHWARLGLKLSLTAFVLIIVGRVLLNAFTAYWQAVHPPPPPPPTVGFGLLPAPSFEVDAKYQAKLPKTYKLETANGRLGDFAGQALVYLMPKNSPSLLDHEDAMKLAKQYGFVFEPEVLDDKHYRWIKPGKLTQIFDLNIVDHSFTYRTDYLEKPELMLDADTLPLKYEAVELVKGFIKAGHQLESDIATASGEVKYLKIVGNNLEPALSASDADLMSVDLKRTPVEGRYQTYTQEGENGVIHALVSGYGSGQTQLVKVRNAYYPVDYLNYETYPLKDVREAWNLLVSGHGYVAVNHSPNDQVVVRQVELGYYDDIHGSQYLQPIYVFKGDGDFLGFVPAVDGRYLSQKNQTQP